MVSGTWDRKDSSVDVLVTDTNNKAVNTRALIDKNIKTGPNQNGSGYFIKIIDFAVLHGF